MELSCELVWRSPNLAGSSIKYEIYFWRQNELCAIPTLLTRIGWRALAGAGTSSSSITRRLPQQLSSFSSSPPLGGSSEKPNVNLDEQQNLLHGFDEVAQTVQRCRERRDEFEWYTRENAFQSSPLALLNNWLLFYHLNRLQHVHRDLDMLEFLAGAKHALETTSLAMFSREFASFVTGATNTCEAADYLHSVLAPVSLDALKDYIRQSEHSGLRMEMLKLTVHAAYLIGAQYDRVPRRSTRNALGAEVVGVPVDERLRLQVCFKVTEHMNVKLDDAEPKPVVKPNVAIWQFESFVTSLDAIEWRIEPLKMVSS